MNKKISTLVACLLMVLPPAVPAEILWTHTKPQLNATHIYIGEINGYGKPSGFHARFNGQVPENIRILGITSQPNKAGVYMAQIAIRDDRSGEWKEKLSSMFPDSMNTMEVVKAILHAYRNREEGHSQPWRGPSGLGFPIEGTQLANGMINTAYPVFMRDK